MVKPPQTFNIFIMLCAVISHRELGDKEDSIPSGAPACNDDFILFGEFYLKAKVSEKWKYANFVLILASKRTTMTFLEWIQNEVRTWEWGLERGEERESKKEETITARVDQVLRFKSRGSFPFCQNNIKICGFAKRWSWFWLWRDSLTTQICLLLISHFNCKSRCAVIVIALALPPNWTHDAKPLKIYLKRKQQQEEKSKFE